MGRCFPPDSRAPGPAVLLTVISLLLSVFTATTCDIDGQALRLYLFVDGWFKQSREGEVYLCESDLCWRLQVPRF
jgi:hypothetical protein